MNIKRPDPFPDARQTKKQKTEAIGGASPMDGIEIIISEAKTNHELSASEQIQQIWATGKIQASYFSKLGDVKLSQEEAHALLGLLSIPEELQSGFNLFLLGTCLVVLGKLDAAEEAFHEASVKLRNSLQTSDNLLVLGCLSQRAGQQEEAKFYFDWASKVARETVAFAHLGLFCFHTQKEDQVNAIQNLQTASHQGNICANYNLGMVYEKQDNLDESIRYYQKAADQGLVKANFRLGLLHWTTGDKDRALHYFKACVDKGFLQAYYHLGLCYKELLSGEGPRKYFLFMVNLNPPPQEEEQWIREKFDHDFKQAYHELGLWAISNNEEAEAIKYFKIGWKKGNLSDSYFQLGKLYLKKKETLDEAINVFRQLALQGCKESLKELGRVYSEQGYEQIAQQYLALAQSSEPLTDAQSLPPIPPQGWASWLGWK